MPFSERTTKEEHLDIHLPKSVNLKWGLAVRVKVSVNGNKLKYFLEIGSKKLLRKL